MITVLVVVGTRPEVIKMAPVVCALREASGRARTVLCSTGQQRELVDQALAIFNLRPDVALDVMEPDQPLARLTAKLFQSLDPVVCDLKPDWVIAQGDTTSVMVSALTAFYRRVPFGHVEAGLRTGDLARPFPEEANRDIADRVAAVLFAPTARAQRNLIDEGIAAAKIHVTGNTVVDALLSIARRPYEWAAGPLSRVPLGRRLVLVTAHRRESFGEDLRRQCEAVRELAARFSADAQFVWPVHPNPNVVGPVRAALHGAANISLIEPLDYVAQVHLMRRCSLILTDSGGIQEEAPTFSVPVLVLRDKTERPEGIEAGVARLTGSDPRRIVAEATRLLEDPAAHKAMAPGINPYGDGQAAPRIVRALLS
jgi:UDP-N-acetylglucosamine 2-epimerase (non-hydrolysing)